jgi:hypothetical protein
MGYANGLPRRGRVRVALVVALLAVAGGARAQDAIVRPQKTVKAQAAVRRAVTDETARQAMLEAKDARARASCMQAMARKVDAAALQLDRAGAEQKDERREALEDLVNDLAFCSLVTADQPEP